MEIKVLTWKEFKELIQAEGVEDGDVIEQIGVRNEPKVDPRQAEEHWSLESAKHRIVRIGTHIEPTDRKWA